MILALHQMLFVFIKWRRMRGVGRMVDVRRREIHKAFWLGYLMEKDHLEDLDADGRILLKLIFNKRCRKF
jgi:hypothetical protein